MDRIPNNKKSYLRSYNVFRIEDLSNRFDFWFGFGKFGFCYRWESSVDIKPQWPIIRLESAFRKKTLDSVKKKYYIVDILSEEQTTLCIFK